jgi:hypothetical protein
MVFRQVVCGEGNPDSKASAAGQGYYITIYLLYL